MTRLLYTLLGTLEIMLGVRFGAFIYGTTAPLLTPFIDLLATPTRGDIPVEITTLIAMLGYLLFFWGMVQVIRLFGERRNIRSVSEQTLDGARTTHTTTLG